MAISPKIELKINGAWTNATRYDTNTKVLESPGISITRGTNNVQDRTPASTCTWVWQDPNGVYNNDNPRSPYYGVLPRNTPVRVSVPRTNTALLIVDAQDGAHAATTDKAAIELTGDIDVRIEVEPRYWRRFGSNGSKSYVLCSKWADTTNRGWHLRVSETGFVTLGFSTTGSNTTSAASTVAVPATGRIAIRATLDVDNGSSQHVTTFYTAPSIGGTWTQLGATVTQSSAVSIFASTADLEVGSINGGNPQGSSVNFYNYIGRIYSFELYNGIAGSLVAKSDFTAQTTGTTSFSDGLGNTWTLTGVAEITNADYRFHGELSAPAQSAEFSADGVGKHVEMSGEAGGIIRRLTTNQTPLQSPIYRNFNNYGANGWWPCEDASGATAVGSAVTGSDPATITDITFSGFDSTLAGSAGVITCGGTGPLFVGTAKVVATTTETHFIGYFKFPSIPLSAQTLFSVYSDGTVKRWDFVVDATQYTLNGYDVGGSRIVQKQTLFGTGADPTNWIAYHIQLTNVAGTITPKSEWQVIGTDIALSATGAGTLTYAGNNGTFTKIVVQGIAALSGVKLAHLMVSNQVGLVFWNGTTQDFAKFSRGYAGETADARFIRICNEQGIGYCILGKLGDSEFMGPQPIDTVMNVLYQCQEVDGGLITEARDRLNTLEYRTRTFLLNQYGLSLSYSVGKHLSGRFTSTPDDTNVVNDVQLSRDNGGTARATLDVGPMSTQAPPNGIGRVPNSPSINNYVDSRLPSLAQYALYLGTWPEARYTSVEMLLHRTEFTSDSATLLLAQKTDLGDPITVTDMPQFTAADAVQLMARGVTETLNNFERKLAFSTVPYGLYRVSELSTATGEELRADAARDSSYAGQTQIAAATSSATSLTVTTLSGPVLPTTAGDPTQFPFDVWQAGERMTVTAVVGATSPQTVTVTRSVNGVVKAIAANTPMTVVQYFNVAL